MFGLIKNYIKMKKQEIQLKSMFYGVIIDFIKSQEDIIDLVKKLYDELKDADQDELKDLIATKIVEFANEQK